ncbi:DNA primase RepB-like protein [Paraburkholderia sp. RAU2J]|uniref:DNA-primase RepB domain-containing protein n=1 Tax=Paraburkholderia sp. RAU2J TaxID=1938810 RepID=UPI000F1AF4AA|nr:DNA-primase RepB domain-containing protein [Paraburkholderia sp. RAU2J]RKT25480.1 DNA primase RepB-like protein [Paraburkholderia sp. RAU2J]
MPNLNDAEKREDDISVSAQRHTVSVEALCKTPAKRREMAEEFLLELSANCEDDERVLVCQKDEVDGGWPMKGFNESTTLREDENIYACIATVNKSAHKDTGKPVWSRKIEHFRGGHALMLDDLGTGKGSKGAMTVDALASMLPPTAVVETSPDNFQVWYFFDAPERDAKRFKNFIVSFVEQVMVEGGDKLDDPVRIARVPFGVNTKRTPDGVLKYADESGRPWTVRLADADYDRRYSIDRIAAAFNVEIRESAKYEKREVKTVGNAFDDAVLAAEVEALREAGSLLEDRSTPGKYRIRCPWGAEHSSGDGLDAFIAGPSAGMDNPYVFSCSHSTCKEAKRGWTAFVKEGCGTHIEKLVEAALIQVNAEAAANDSVWAEFLFADGLSAVVEKAEEPSKVEEKSAADAMKRGVDDRAESESRSSADLGVGAANWMKGWWYSMAEGKVCRPGSNFLYSQQDFNAAFGSLFAPLRKDKALTQGAQSAYTYVQDNHRFNMCAATAYVCGHPSVFQWEGNVWVNLFNEKSIPKTAEEYTPEGLAAIKLITDHIDNLTGNEDNSSRILSWIAMNVKKPGELIGFAPLIKGIEGDGKTIIFQGLMGALLGDANVSLVSGDEITENTGWAKGHAVVAIEEIKAASGDNRHQITNKIKQYITNKKVDVVDKYVKRHVTMNATNYVGMTNFANALPLKDGDRRWMVIFTQWKAIEELIKKVGGLEAYFGRIGHAIKTQAPQIRKFFGEYQLCEGWYWGMRAPETEDKKVMVGLEATDSGKTKLDAYFEVGELGVSRDVVATSLLGEHIARDTGVRSRNTRQIATMMVDMGWHRVPFDVFWNDKAQTVYVRDAKDYEGRTRQMATERVKKLLVATDTQENRKKWEPFPKASGF